MVLRVLPFKGLQAWCCRVGVHFVRLRVAVRHAERLFLEVRAIPMVGLEFGSMLVQRDRVSKSADNGVGGSER